MAAKDISEPKNLDDFVRIQGPDKGSARDGSRVTVGQAGDRDSCVKLVDGKLQITGDDEFRRTVEATYEAIANPIQRLWPLTQARLQARTRTHLEQVDAGKIKAFDVG